MLKDTERFKNRDAMLYSKPKFNIEWVTAC